MDLSVVIPLYNERENSARCTRNWRGSSLRSGVSHEIIFVDDGSNDGGIDDLREIKASDPNVSVIRLARTPGKLPRCNAASQTAKGDIVVALDGDVENDPADIPRLMAPLAEGTTSSAGGAPSGGRARH